MDSNDIPESEWKQEMLDALAEGQKIKAIKIYRANTGSDLKKAKEQVEKILAELAEQYPEEFSQKAGCAAVILSVSLLPSLLSPWPWHPSFLKSTQLLLRVA